MATKIYFIAGPEAAFKEKVISDLTNMYFQEGKTVVTKYKAARIDNLQLYGTMPTWAVVDRVDSTVYNSLNTCDILILAGWHINDVIGEIADKYPDATIIVVRSSIEDSLIKERMIDTVGEQQADAIITSENTYLANFWASRQLTPTWTKVSEDPAVRIFNSDHTINEYTQGHLEITLLGEIN
jgi:hypothetical protein